MKIYIYFLVGFFSNLSKASAETFLAFSDITSEERKALFASRPRLAKGREIKRLKGEELGEPHLIIGRVNLIYPRSLFARL